MDKVKTDAAGWMAKAITYIICVCPPVVIANVTHWAATVVSGKKMSTRARFAIFIGSFGIASVVHWLCEIWSAGRIEWVFIWSTSVGAEQILKFLYLEFGNNVKDWIKGQIVFFTKPRDKS